MANDTEKKLRCVICGGETSRIFRGKSICDACDTRIDNLVALHASSHEAANFKEQVLDACVTFAREKHPAGLSYSQTLHDLKENGTGFGAISKSVGRHIFFKEFIRLVIDSNFIRRCMEPLQNVSKITITYAGGAIFSFNGRLLNEDDPEYLLKTEKPMFQFTKQTGGTYRVHQSFVLDINEVPEDDHKD